MAQPLVAPAWLASQMQEGNKYLRIFDTTITLAGLGDEAFKSVHIEGAQFLNLFMHTTPTKEQPVNLPDPAKFQEYLRDLGINTSSHVIIYENTPLHGIAGPRAWWMLRAYGIKNVSLLDGGLTRWQTEGHPVTDRLTQYQKGDVNVTQDKALVKSYDEVRASSDVLFVDTRPPENYSGDEEEPSQLLQAFMPALGMTKEGFKIHTGHVPGAVNVPYPSLFQDDGVSYKPKEQLLSLFQKQGVKLSGHVTGTCYVGLTACMFALCASVCGFNDVSIYAGSWVEYGQIAPAERVERSTKKHVQRL